MLTGCAIAVVILGVIIVLQLYALHDIAHQTLVQISLVRQEAQGRR